MDYRWTWQCCGRAVLQPTHYPLAVEQHQGITLDRVKQIAAEAGHG